MDPNKNKNELINQGTTQQPQQFQNSQEAYSVNVGPTKYGPKKKIIILMASITILVGLGLGGSLLFKAQKRYEDDQVGIAKNQKETSQKDLEVVYSRWLPTMDWESSPVRKSGIVAGEIINNTQRTIEPEILVYWPRYNREYWPRDNREETSMQKPRISKRFLEPGEKAAFSTYISTDFPGEYEVEVIERENSYGKIDAKDPSFSIVSETISLKDAKHTGKIKNDSSEETLSYLICTYYDASNKVIYVAEQNFFLKNGQYFQPKTTTDFDLYLGEFIPPLKIDHYEFGAQ